MTPGMANIEMDRAVPRAERLGAAPMTWRSRHGTLFEAAGLIDHTTRDGRVVGLRQWRASPCAVCGAAFTHATVEGYPLTTAWWPTRCPGCRAAVRAARAAQADGADAAERAALASAPDPQTLAKRSLKRARAALRDRRLADRRAARAGARCWGAMVDELLALAYGPPQPWAEGEVPLGPAADNADDWLRGSGP